MCLWGPSRAKSSVADSGPSGARPPVPPVRRRSPPATARPAAAYGRPRGERGGGIHRVRGSSGAVRGLDWGPGFFSPDLSLHTQRHPPVVTLQKANNNYNNNAGEKSPPSLPAKVLVRGVFRGARGPGLPPERPFRSRPARAPLAPPLALHSCWPWVGVQTNSRALQTAGGKGEESQRRETPSPFPPHGRGQELPCTACKRMEKVPSGSPKPVVVVASLLPAAVLRRMLGAGSKPTPRAVTERGAQPGGKPAEEGCWVGGCCPEVSHARSWVVEVVAQANHRTHCWPLGPNKTPKQNFQTKLRGSYRTGRGGVGRRGKPAERLLSLGGEGGPAGGAASPALPPPLTPHPSPLTPHPSPLGTRPAPPRPPPTARGAAGGEGQLGTEVHTTLKP